MKRSLFIAILLLICFAAHAQFKAHFYLQRDATFTTKDNADYAVVEYPGMTADQLYTMVKSNINSLYKSPKDVMSEVENVSITVRGYSKRIVIDKYGYSGYYNLNFRFKDGKIRVAAPIVDNDVYSWGNNTRWDFADAISFFFNKKDGSVKPKKLNYKELTENNLNLIIYQIIQNQEETQSKEDNW